MEVRPYLTAGAAIVTTGALVVAMPVIVPSPTPPDVRISATAPESVYADVALRFTSQELFNAIFSGFPDTNGPRGLVGLALLLSDDAFGEGSPASAFIEGGIVGLARSFFPDDTVAAAFLDGGIVGVATLLTDGVPLLNSFFGGGPNDTPGGIVGVADELTDGVPLVNSFVTGGIVGVADELTAGNAVVNAFVNGGIVGLASALAPEGSLIKTFIDGGFVPATEQVLVGATAGDPVISQGIMSFFSGYPFEVPAVEDDPETEDIDESADAVPAGPAGIVGLVHYILDRLAGNPTTPPADEALTAVEGGAEVTGSQDLAILAAGPQGAQVTQGTQAFSLQQFSAAARSGLPAANEPLEPSENGITVSITDLASDPVDPSTVETTDPVDTLDPVDTTDQTAVDIVDPVDTTDPVETTDPDPTVTPVGATTPGSGSGSVPAGQPPVSTPPPATDPVVDPVDPDPVKPVVNEEEEAAGDDDATDLKDGNKFEPTPILLQNGRGGGGSALDETIQRWKDFGSKLGIGGGGAPAPSAPTGGGAPAAGEGAEGS